jgi:hypothetical protein
MEKRYGVAISLTGDRDVPPGEGRLDFLREESRKEVNHEPPVPNETAA